jgi:hypothetical protein
MPFPPGVILHGLCLPLWEYTAQNVPSPLGAILRRLCLPRLRLYCMPTLINKSQAFQNKVLRMIIKLPRVTPIKMLHDETEMGFLTITLRTQHPQCIKKSVFSEN